MNIVYRFRIYPNKSQKELFARTFGCVRFVYNRMLAEKKEYSADSLQELLSGFFGWFSEVQVKKESGEKLYDKLRKWKYYFAEW